MQPLPFGAWLILLPRPSPLWLLQFSYLFTSCGGFWQISPSPWIIPSDLPRIANSQGSHLYPLEKTIPRVCPFLEKIGEEICYIGFGVWLLFLSNIHLRFIDVTVWIEFLSFYCWTHQLAYSGMRVVPRSRRLQTKRPSLSTQWSVWAFTFSFLLGRHLGVGLLGYLYARLCRERLFPEWQLSLQPVTCERQLFHSRGRACNSQGIFHHSDRCVVVFCIYI